jgi:anthranilate/para-aminobenzoate synthase component II
MPGKFLANLGIHRAFIGHQPRLAIRVTHDHVPQGLGSHVSHPARARTAATLNHGQDRDLGRDSAERLVAGFPADVALIGFHDLVMAA